MRQMSMIYLSRWCALLAVLSLFAALVGCGGGGGGGGGGGQTTQVKGTILSADTSAPPNTAATVTIAGLQAAASTTDGTFTLSNVPATAKSLTVTATGAQTLTLPISLTANQTNDLGQIYITYDADGYTANATGRVVTQDTNTPVGNATVILAGQTTTTKTDGTFSFTNLPVGLGNVAGTFGKITAPTFEDKPITADVLRFPLVKGNNNLGDIPIASPVSSTTPSPPYTIKGKVTIQGNAQAGVQVSLTTGSTPLGVTTTDANGNYFFWLVPGTYTVTASQSGLTTQSVQVTLVKTDTPVTATTINLVP